MAFDRFNDKPQRREKRDGEQFGSKGGRFESFGRDRGFGRGEGRFGERGGDRFVGRGERKPFGARPFREELGGRSGPRAKAVDKRRFADRAAFVSNATVRLDGDVAKFFKTSEDVNAALRMVIALTKTVRCEQVPAEVESAEAERSQEVNDESVVLEEKNE